MHKALRIEKIKKIRKKLYIKIEKRQRSIRRAKVGCGLSFAQKTEMPYDTRTIRTYRVYIFVLLYMIRVYNGETAVLPLFVRYARFYFCVCGLFAVVAKYGLKRLFEERGAAAKHHVGVFSLAWRAAAVLVLVA